MKQKAINLYTLQDLQLDSARFNEIAGNDIKVSKEDLIFQASLIEEELKEMQSGIIQDDKEAILDGIIDVLVTAYGMVQKLEKLGYDINAASSVVAMNNLSKYPRDLSVATETLHRNLTWNMLYNSKENVYVIRDSQGKIRKPVGFEKVDLSSFVPE